MENLCSECSIELSKEEIQLNTEFPIGKFYCNFCNDRKEREIIQRLNDLEIEQFEEDLIGK